MQQNIKTGKSSSTFCNFPFKSVWVGGPGYMNPCCVAQFSKQKEFQIPKNSINEYWNSPELNGLRNDLMNGKKNPACQHCWRQESQGMTSKRTRQSELANVTVDVENPQIKVLSLQLTNLCNLGCRMCHHWSSSVIEDENRKHQSLYYSDKYKIDDDPDWHHDPLNFSELEQQRNWWSDETFLQEIYKILHNINYIDVSGGEPTLNKTLLNILDYCIDNDLAKNIWLEITTNGQQVNPKLMERLNKFGNVSVFVSIDGYQDVYEYIRWKGSWSTLEKNLKYLIEHADKQVSVICHMTSQVLNILNLTELLDWFQKNNIRWNDIDPVTRPKHHDVLILPEEVRLVAHKRWNNFLNNNKLSPRQETNVVNTIKTLEVTDQEHQEKYWKYFVRDTMLKDEIRKQNFKKSVPDLYNMIKERFVL